MGYTGLEHWNESDRAADFRYTLIKNFTPLINKEIKVEDNAYNTDGCINVALIIESGLFDSLRNYELEDINFALLVKKLKETIELAGPKYKKDWNDEENRKYHLTSYKRMLKSVEKFLKEKQIQL